MATKKEIELCQEILALAITVNSQGKYSVWVDYSGHVHSIEVCVSPLWSEGVKDLEGWACNDRCIYLSTGYRPSSRERKDNAIHDITRQLGKIKADLAAMITGEVSK